MSWDLQHINGGPFRFIFPAGSGGYGGPGAVAGSGHELFVSVYNGQLHFAYFDAKGNVQDTWYDGVHWRPQQINNANGSGPTVPGQYIASATATAAAAGDLFVSVYNNQQHFAYRDAYGHIQDVWY